MTPQDKLVVGEMVRSKAFQLFYNELREYCHDSILDTFSLNTLSDENMHDLHTDAKALKLITTYKNTHESYTQSEMDTELELIEIEKEEMTDDA